MIGLNFWALIVAAGVGAAGSGWAAWELGRAPLHAANAELREAQATMRVANAETHRIAAQAAARRLQAATDRSHTLGAQLLRQTTANATLAQEKTHALQTATAGRACLDDRALRVLHGSPGLSVAAPGGLPPAGAGAAATGGATATDTDIGTWAIAVGQQYETCRNRLGALIDWHAAPPQEPHREPAQ